MRFIELTIDVPNVTGWLMNAEKAEVPPHVSPRCSVNDDEKCLRNTQACKDLCGIWGRLKMRRALFDPPNATLFKKKGFASF